MSDRDAKPGTLLAQDLALGVYLEALLAEAPAPVAAPPVTAPAVTPAAAVPASVADLTVKAAAAPAEPDALIPDWAEGPFQCLLFTVRGLTLAVPLVTLSGVERRETRPTLLPGKPEWFLGLLTVRDHNAAIIDTARVVMPERVRANDPEYQHVLLVAGGRVGLACDAVAEVVQLGPDQVRWRTSRTRRPWLAGMVIDRMCALLDVDIIAEMVARRA